MTKHPFCCHIAVTLSFLHHHSTPSSKICCHTTITLLSHHYHRSHFFSKNQLLPRRISSSPRKPPLFSRKSPTFPRKCPMFFRKSGTSSKKALTSVAQPCDRCDRKKHKTPGIYARVRPCSISCAAQLRPSREGSCGCIYIKLGRKDIPTTNSERHKKKSKRRCASQQTRWGA